MAQETDGGSLEQMLTDLQKQLGKKQSFESAVSSLTHIVSDLFCKASLAHQKLIYTTVCRAAILLKTRYTAVGFWMAGLQLFEATLQVVAKPDEKQNIQSYIAKAHEIIGDSQEEARPVLRTGREPGFLFEGQLTVDQEPPRPAWMVAQNLLAALVSEREQRNVPGETSRTEAPALEQLMTTDIQEIMQTVNGFDINDFGTGLEEAIQATLQEVGAMPRGTPPASKDAVAKLPTLNVTEALLKQLGVDVECAVCRDQLVVGSKMQEMPCKHLFHPDCLKPWLDEHNSCPVCRFELRTDDHDYESKKERDKEFEEERKGAQNAVRGGEFMYI